MIDPGSDPVEISMHFSPDDWTEARLTALVSSYQDKLHAMGAPVEDIVTQLDKRADGSANVHVSWDRRGTAKKTMTGRDALGRLVPGGNENAPGLIMYTEEDGETYLEVPDEQPSAPLGQGGRTPPTETATHRQERPAVPWTWFAGIAGGVLAVVGGIAWIRGRKKN